MHAAHAEILVPTRRGRDRLRRALHSLERQTAPARICVIDNASSDGTREMLASEFPGVRVCRPTRNLGFGPAINLGARSSEAEVLILMNDDAEASDDFVRQMLEARRRAGSEMVAGCLRAADGTIESLGIQVDQNLNGYDVAFGQEFGSAARPRVLGPTGGAAGYLRSAFLSVGGFDESIFAYLEDVDLAIRMRSAGMGCAVAPGAYVWHVHSATLGSRSSEKNEHLAFSRRYLLAKYRRALPRRRLAAALVTDLLVYGGKAVIDGNVGAFRGWRRAGRLARTGAISPSPIDPTPLLDELSLREQLARRMARRA